MREDDTLVTHRPKRGIEDDTSMICASASRFGPSAFPELRTLFGVNGDCTHTIDQNRPPSEWEDLVEMYSLCDLTYEKDKLMAISGMARKVHSATGQAWCAGIEADRLCQQLLWFPTINGMTIPTHPRCPSWSWAACDGSLQYPAETRSTSFGARCRFVQLRDDADRPTIWLNGPGRLTLRVDLLLLYKHARRITFRSDPVRCGRAIPLSMMTMVYHA